MKERIICFITAFAIALMPVTAYAQETKEVQGTEEAQTLPSGLDIEELPHVVDTYVKEHEDTTAAMSVAVFNSKETLFSKGYGYTNIEEHLENTEDSVFEWGSCTKLITWSCIMQLAEQGKLDLDEDVRTYLPDGFLKKLRYETPVTILDLMNHTGGWQENYTDLYLEADGQSKSLAETLAYMEPKQIYEPGTRLAYSNWGTGLAGYIVECISGQSYDAYVKEHIFKPLGMEHTAIRTDLSDQSYVREQRMKENCYEADGTSMGTCFYQITLPPAGMATGTLSDFVKFGQAFMKQDNEETPLFQHRETLDEMLSPSRYFADGKTARNCHGFWTDVQNVPLLWHDGGTNGSTSWFAFDRESQTGVIILTNQNEESVYTCGILPMVFGENSFNTYLDKNDISGTYLALRTCMEGVTKPFRLLSYIMIPQPVQGQYGGNGFMLANAGGDKYLLQMENKDYLFFSKKTADGEQLLELPGSDYKKVSAMNFYGQLALMFLFIIAAGYSLIMLICMLISKLRGRKLVFGLPRFLNYSATLLGFVFTALTLLTLIDGVSTFAEVRGCILLNMIFMLVPFAYLIDLIVHFKKMKMTARAGVQAVVCALTGLIMSIHCLYFNSFMFW